MKIQPRELNMSNVLDCFDTIERLKTQETCCVLSNADNGAKEVSGKFVGIRGTTIGVQIVLRCENGQEVWANWRLSRADRDMLLWYVEHWKTMVIE